jgi:hypothetical protein
MVKLVAKRKLANVVHAAINSGISPKKVETPEI